MNGTTPIKRNCRIFRYSAVAAIAAFVAVAAQASVPIPVQLEQLASDAELVIIGRVVGQESRFNDGKTMILTHTTLEVEESIAGDGSKQIEISEYGGRVGDLAMVSPAQVVYAPGEHVLVFVCRDALGLRRTCGAHQGRMTVTAADNGSLDVRGIVAGELVRDSLTRLRALVLAARERSR